MIPSKKLVPSFPTFVSSTALLMVSALPGVPLEDFFFFFFLDLLFVLDCWFEELLAPSCMPSSFFCISFTTVLVSFCSSIMLPGAR